MNQIQFPPPPDLLAAFKGPACKWRRYGKGREVELRHQFDRTLITDEYASDDDVMCAVISMMVTVSAWF